MEKLSFVLIALGLVAIHSSEAGTPIFSCLGASSNCYAVVAGPADFKTASQKCHELGGILASIHNDQENDFIYVLTKKVDPRQAYWVGLRLQVHNDTDKIYSASWTDASAMDFGDPIKLSRGTKPWGPGQPDNLAGKGPEEECVHLAPNGWNDAPCDWEEDKTVTHNKAPYGYVCQKS